MKIAKLFALLLSINMQSILLGKNFKNLKHLYARQSLTKRRQICVIISPKIAGILFESLHFQLNGKILLSHMLFEGINRFWSAQLTRNEGDFSVRRASCPLPRSYCYLHAS